MSVSDFQNYTRISVTFDIDSHLNLSDESYVFLSRIFQYNSFLSHESQTDN
jgi:hypothetical protein